MTAAPTDTPLRYDAFISYSRRDIAFAALLERELERYRPPAGIGASRHLEIFRDAQDLIGSDYGAAIAAALESSAKLIVVCSPAAAQSEYVGDEIRRFLTQRTATDIIVVLLSGLPNNETAPGQESLRAFPSALYDAFEMPLAISFLDFQIGEQKLAKPPYADAWLSLLASIVGVSRTVLEQRQRQREARQRNTVRGIAAAVFAVLSAATVYSVRQKQLADGQRDVATAQRDAARRERKLAEEQKLLALRGDSMWRTAMAKQSNEAGHHVAAALHALEALPKDMTRPERPYVAAAEVELARAVPHLHAPRVLRASEARVTFGTFSPDGRQVATGAHDGVRLWDVATGQLVRELSGMGRRAAHVAFGPAGQGVVGATYGGLRMWDTSTGHEKAFGGAQAYADHVTISGDGERVVFATFLDAFSLWDARTGALLARPEVSGIAHAVFSPDGERIVTTDRFDGTASVWDGRTGRLVKTLKGHAAGHYYACFSPDSRSVLTASADHTARLWDLRTGRQRVLSGHTDKVFHADFSRDGALVVTASKDHSARVWSASTGKLSTTFSGHGDEVRHATFTPDGKWVVSSSRDDTARVWRVSDGRERAVLSGHDADVTHAAVSPDGKRILTTGGNSARLWDLGELEPHSLFRDPELVTHGAFSRDGRRMAITALDLRGDARMTGVRVMDLERGEWLLDWHARGPEQRDGILRNPIISLEFAGESTRLVWATYDTAWVWSDGEPQRFDVGASPIKALSPRGDVLAAGEPGGRIHLWDVGKRSHIATLTGHHSAVRALAFSADGAWLVSASMDSVARVWSVSRHAPQSKLELPVGFPSNLALSRDGMLAAVASWVSNDRTVRVFDAQSGAIVRALPMQVNIHDVAFSPTDGTLAISCGFDPNDPGNKARQAEVQLWDTRTWEKRHALPHTMPPNQMAFSRDGGRLVTVSIENTARVWRVETGEQIALLPHAGPVDEARFDATGTHVLTFHRALEDATTQNAAQLWRVYPDTQALIDDARRRLGGEQFDAEERERLFLGAHSARAVQ